MSDVILEMRNNTKTFPGERALDNVNFSVKQGEIHALVGENGAGKSTLMNVLSGVYPYGSYEGEIYFEGKEVRFYNIHQSEEVGLVDRKSTRLNSSHLVISYAVFCLKKRSQSS